MENGAPSSANKHRFSKFRKKQNTLPENSPRGLGTTGEGHAEGIASAVGLKKTESTSKKKESSNGVKLAVVKPNADGWLWVYKSANWNDKAQKVKPGEAFTIASTVTVKGSKMYKLKSGLYITAADKYVQVKTK
ncbi:DUF5776 domain-containing protein [Bacillus atrophaeus]|uniref:DUF5776 domain-containing protein n=1 Tax=Bacillus atrophaeus TaxID=1452 RepID=UPI0022829D6C|nr:DUF5776 domain-containing protein [Bacillus atrophaeus]MCY8489675.1 DUF5776 domain-containing protein [Bacillus atrophaeus]MCY8817710.1 DUF5776 domain-containing protein [Bacillus atrophaeus]